MALYENSEEVQEFASKIRERKTRSKYYRLTTLHWYYDRENEVFGICRDYEPNKGYHTLAEHRDILTDKIISNPFLYDARFELASKADFIDPSMGKFLSRITLPPLCSWERSGIDAERKRKFIFNNITPFIAHRLGKRYNLHVEDVTPFLLDDKGSASVLSFLIRRDEKHLFLGGLDITRDIVSLTPTSDRESVSSHICIEKNEKLTDDFYRLGAKNCCFFASVNIPIDDICVSGALLRCLIVEANRTYCEADRVISSYVDRGLSLTKPSKALYSSQEELYQANEQFSSKVIDHLVK